MGVLWGCAAWAQPRLAVFLIEEEPLIQETTGKVKAELWEALSSAKPSEVALLPMPRLVRPSELLTLPLLGVAFNEAHKAMKEKRFSEARISFKKAIELALERPERAQFGQVFDAYVGWAVASVEDGDEEEARLLLRVLARLAPNYVLPRNLPPVFKREFERAKLFINKQPKGSISIESMAGAVVFLNGQPVGIAPVVVANLPYGTHYVSVEGQHFDMRFGRAVELNSARAQVRGIPKKMVLRLPAGSAVDPSLTPFLDAAALERLEVLAKDLGAEFIWVGFVKEVEPGHFNLSMALFHAKRKCFLFLAPIGFSKSLIGKAVLGKRVSNALLQRIQAADKEPAAKLPLDWRAVDATEPASF